MPKDVAVNSSSTSLPSQNLEGPARLKERGNKLPELKNKLDKRIMITKDSNEAFILAKAAARVNSSNVQVNGE